MTIDEAIEKIENIEPVNISSMYGEDIIRCIDIESCDDCHKLALYIAENDLADEILKDAVWNMACEMGDSFSELILDSIDMAIVHVIGNDKIEELRR